MTTLATLLTEAQVQQVHEASLEIVETVGLLVRNKKARTLLAKHGCQVNPDTHLVKFPRAVVEEFRAAYPATFTFHGRDPQYDCTISGHKNGSEAGILPDNGVGPDTGPFIMTGSSAPNIIDPVTGRERRARSDDMARIAHLVNELPAIDLFSVSTLADDALPGHFSLARYYPALKNCLKPVRGNVPNLAEAQTILKLGFLVAGSEAAYRARPLITHHYCCVVSPLTLDNDSTELLIFLTENNLPGYATVVPTVGLTAPLTLMGVLAQGNAEFLAWATLKQMIRPGAPLLYSVLPAVADMRTGAYAPGAIETGMLTMAFTQMARYYGLPSAGYVGLTNAKLCDAQAGFEKSLSPMAATLAGLDIINMAGLIDALMAFDYAMLTIDNEIAEMIKRVKHGLDFSPENMALDLIAETGPGGMFIDKPHTLKRMKTGTLLPHIANRELRQVWADNGSLDAQATAMQRVRNILTHDNPALFSPDVDARVRAEFAGLVAGDSVPPLGWKSASPLPSRRRKNKRNRKAT